MPWQGKDQMIFDVPHPCRILFQCKNSAHWAAQDGGFPLSSYRKEWWSQQKGVRQMLCPCGHSVGSLFLVIFQSEHSSASLYLLRGFLGCQPFFSSLRSSLLVVPIRAFRLDSPEILHRKGASDIYVLLAWICVHSTGPVRKHCVQGASYVTAQTLRGFWETQQQGQLFWLLPRKHKMVFWAHTSPRGRLLNILTCFQFSENPLSWEGGMIKNVTQKMQLVIFLPQQPYNDITQ